MKIGVVSAHYMEEMGYQEIHLAKAYARLGHTVKVFTTPAVVALAGNVNLKKYKTGISKDKKYGFEILRLPATSFKSKTVSFSLEKSVLEFQPDVLIVLGVAKIFPYGILNERINKICHIVSIYGDAAEYLSRNTFTQRLMAHVHEAGYKLIKEPLYKRAVKYSDRLVMNIPETNEYFLNFLKGQIKTEFEKKRQMLYLGYDPEQYFYNAKLRKETREKLNIKDDEVVIITSTRVIRRKNLEGNIAQISSIRKSGKKIIYVIVGFLNDDYEKELKAFIASQPQPEIFKCFPFLNSTEINKLYCAADAGIWLKVAISIQEAMGTGLPVILENKPSQNHLIEDGINGWFFEKNNYNTVIEKITDILVSKSTNREELQRKNASKLSYDAIAQRIIENLPGKKK